MLLLDPETGVKRAAVFMIDAETAANADAYANISIADIPKNHNRVRADAAYTAYKEYFRNNAEKLDKVFLYNLFTAPESNNDALGVGSEQPVDIIFTRKHNFGTKKWPDHRSIVTSVSNCRIYRLTSDNLLYVTAYGEKCRTMIGNLIAIVRR